jgi:CTP-dependent riboflavin kinase
MKRLAGTVQTGCNDANRWLRRFSGVYAQWLGVELYPGSLNLDTGSHFDWHAAEILPFRRRFSLLPYGGERDIFMIPCSIVVPSRQSCWLWTTTTAADNRSDPTVVELVAPVCLRSSLGLVDGSQVTIQYPEEWAEPSRQTPPWAAAPAARAGGAGPIVGSSAHGR